jgi:uncharacterized membrane protein YeaQ/YmgE (transglycosylase-associated protein family)
MINILLWIVIGGLAGWIASMIMKTNSSQGVVADVILGILGAFVGGLVMNVLGFAGFTGFNVYSLVVATVGAVVLIALRRAIAT